MVFPFTRLLLLYVANTRRKNVNKKNNTIDNFFKMDQFLKLPTERVLMWASLYRIIHSFIEIEK